VTGTLSTGAPLGVNLAVSGQNAVLNFVASAGQTLALNIGTIATSPANGQINVYVYGPSGALTTSSSSATCVFRACRAEISRHAGLMFHVMPGRVKRDGATVTEGYAGGQRAVGSGGRLFCLRMDSPRRVRRYAL
jgi:hypothetical protein